MEFDDKILPGPFPNHPSEMFVSKLFDQPQDFTSGVRNCSTLHKQLYDVCLEQALMKSKSYGLTLQYY